MSSETKVGLFSALSCLLAPFLCRVPGGAAWFGQYLPSNNVSFGGFLLILGFSAIPSFVVLVAGLFSKKPYYFPILGSLPIALFSLCYWHRSNDLSADAQAAISLVMIPISTAILATGGAILGLGIQCLVGRLQSGAEQDAALKSQGVE